MSNTVLDERTRSLVAREADALLQHARFLRGVDKEAIAVNAEERYRGIIIALEYIDSDLANELRSELREYLDDVEAGEAVWHAD